MNALTYNTYMIYILHTAKHIVLQVLIYIAGLADTKGVHDTDTVRLFKLPLLCNKVHSVDFNMKRFRLFMKTWYLYTRMRVSALHRPAGECSP